jgi:hypothetical protein
LPATGVLSLRPTPILLLVLQVNKPNSNYSQASSLCTALGPPPAASPAARRCGDPPRSVDLLIVTVISHCPAVIIIAVALYVAVAIHGYRSVVVGSGYDAGLAVSAGVSPTLDLCFTAAAARLLLAPVQIRSSSPRIWPSTGARLPGIRLAITSSSSRSPSPRPSLVSTTSATLLFVDRFAGQGGVHLTQPSTLQRQATQRFQFAEMSSLQVS